MSSSEISSSYVITSLSECQKRLLHKNSCINCRNAIWREVNGKVVAYCRELFQLCYDQSKENEIIVTKCDLNPELSDKDIKEFRDELDKESKKIIDKDPEIKKFLEEEGISFDDDWLQEDNVKN